MNRTRKLTFFLVVTGLALGTTGAIAQDANKLAMVAQNPLATMVTLPLQANYNTGVGEYERTFFNLNVQPVVPYPGEKWNVIVRTILPINSVPVGEFSSVSGLGDATSTAFFSPAKGSSVTWGLGPIVGFPTASNPELLGSGKWTAGPSGVLFIQAGKWTLGGLVNNVWSFAGDSDRDDVNQFLLQWFINFNLGKGVAIGTVPIVTADWTAEDGQQWTVPWGLQISKVARIGKQPINLLVGYYHNSTTPDGGAENQTRVQINFMFPTVVH